ncbi:MAG: ABC transporter permease subunit [Firmicutes bacterium]|nr:ABC transporter permease subunit [Bacillota bacterium]
MHIFRKTLKEDFLITLIFCIVLCASIYLIIQEFAVARNLDFSSFMDKVPEPLKKMASSFLVMNIFGGYLHVITSVCWIIISGIFVSLVSASLISKELEKKTLPLVLAHPVSRFGVISQKYAAYVFYLIIVCLFSWLGFYAGIKHGVLHMPYNVKFINQALFNGFCFFFALSGFGLFMSVIFTEQKKAAIASMLYFFLSYLSFFLGAFSEKWAVVRDFTLFRFFNTEHLFYWGSYNQKNCIFLLAIGVVMFIISSLVFRQRDISG